VRFSILKIGIVYNSTDGVAPCEAKTNGVRRERVW
jgi:hypothetical protein